jgi:hypothetical protein
VVEGEAVEGEARLVPLCGALAGAFVWPRAVIGAIIRSTVTKTAAKRPDLPALLECSVSEQSIGSPWSFLLSEGGYTKDNIVQSDLREIFL